MDQIKTSSYLNWVPSIGAGVLFAVIAVCIIILVALAAEGKLCCPKCGQSVEEMCGGSKIDHMKNLYSNTRNKRNKRY